MRLDDEVVKPGEKRASRTVVSCDDEAEGDASGAG